MKKLVEEIAKALVDAPEQVSVNEIQSQQSVVIELAATPHPPRERIFAARPTYSPHA